MTTIEIPLGKPEDLHLEFKGRDALRDRLSIARGVVAMLNADGGEVWIGIAENEGRASRLEPIPDIDTEKRRLEDQMVDVIEPPPSHDELRIEIVGKALRLVVAPRPGRGPYSVRGRGGATYFPVRIGARLRPMTRDEQRERFSPRIDVNDGLRRALRRMVEERFDDEDRRERLSFEVRPVPEISLAGREDELRELLRDPELTGNRGSHWVFANRHVMPESRAEGGLVSRWSLYDSNEWWSMEIHRDGTLRYEAGLERFRQPERTEHPRLSQTRTSALWPLGIAELPVSVMRLAAKLYQGQLSADAKVLADLALFGVNGWSLRPGGPRFVGSLSIWTSLDEETAAFPGEDLVLPEPLVFDWPDVLANPDRCGYRLVTQVYREFGFGPESIPVDLFDPVTGRLSLAG